MLLGTLLSFLIAGLGSEDFTTREYSQKALSVLNKDGVLNEYLNAAGGKSRDPEVRMRIGTLTREYRRMEKVPSFRKLLDKLSGEISTGYFYPRLSEFKDEIFVEAVKRFEVLQEYENGCYSTHQPDWVWTSAMIWYIERRFENGATRREILDLLKSLEKVGERNEEEID